MTALAEAEWIIMLGLALGLGLWELARIRRLVRKDREAARKREAGGGIP